MLAVGVDVPGAADRYLAIALAADGDRSRAAEAFARAALLEARISDALPMRTTVWRHALLGDVAPLTPTATLPGLAAEASALLAVLGTP